MKLDYSPLSHVVTHSDVYDRIQERISEEEFELLREEAAVHALTEDDVAALNAVNMLDWDTDFYAVDKLQARILSERAMRKA